ncbi:acyl carrier protein [Flavimaricola marinus]|uniref:Acyl carrier protein n=1 Tax=Flavimaricola marinus TaxID=1819565 RepID=A0A238LI17_9RHOB|nr:acyl carrier protein [Flavimaricola marinus]SMY09268.1 acyl carrier protein [Flavimaricola marinus]
MANTTDALIELISTELKIDKETLGPKTAVFEGGLELDSFAVVDLITKVEARFDIQLSDDDFSMENFADLETLAGVIDRYVAAKG